MNETINSVYESKEIYLNNPEDVRLAHYMYEHNIDLALLEGRL